MSITGHYYAVLCDRCRAAEPLPIEEICDKCDGTGRIPVRVPVTKRLQPRYVGPLAVIAVAIVVMALVALWPVHL